MVERHGNSAESEPKMEGQNLLNSYCLLNAVMSLFCVGAVQCAQILSRKGKLYSFKLISRNLTRIPEYAVLVMFNVSESIPKPKTLSQAIWAATTPYNFLLTRVASLLKSPSFCQLSLSQPSSFGYCLSQVVFRWKKSNRKSISCFFPTRLYLKASEGEEVGETLQLMT